MRRDLMLGFSLIELMVTLVVLAILASIAFPSYQDYILRSRRAEGKGELLRTQQNMERAYTDLNSYTAAWTQIGGASAMVTSEHGYYQVTAASSTASTYTLNSAPQGAQANDKCKTLTITNTSVKGLTGSPTLTVAECW